MIKGRKGLSTIISTMLIILLCFAAAAALIAFLRPYIQNNLNRSTECIPYQNYYHFQQTFENETGNYNYNCYVTEDNGALISTMVAAGTNLSDKDMGNLDGFRLVFSTSENSEGVNLINGQSVNKTLGGIWRIDDSDNTNLILNNPNEALTYVYNASQVYTTANIYPVLKNGRTCDKIDAITIVPCSGVSLP